MRSANAQDGTGEAGMTGGTINAPGPATGGERRVLLSPEFLGEWRSGWRVVFASTLASGVGVALYTYLGGLFIEPLQHSFGWTRTQIATASMFGLLGLVFMPVTGRIADKYGARRTALTGLTLWGLLQIAMALQTGQLWLFYGLMLLSSLVGISTSVIVFTRPVVAIFDHARGSALGLTIAGSGITSFLLYPLVGHVIAHFGWRFGYLLLGVLPFAVGIPIVLRWLNTASPARQSGPAIAVAAPFRLTEVLGDSRLWLLILAMAAGNFPAGGIVSQLQPLLHSKGFGIGPAAMMGSIFALSVALGRIGCGLLLDRFTPSIVIPICLSAPILAAAAMLAPAPPTAVAVVAVAGFGLAQGVEADFLAFFVARYFGYRAYSTLYGLLLAVASSCLTAGMIAYARIYDLTGNYSAALIAQMFLYGFTAIMLIVSERVHRGKGPF